ncbi:MAG: DUF975 family protein [Eubacterium sp.]|nr:DUF975 family protein [Eubacterium sp.]
MKINRAIVKQQAQDLIKGNVFKLFLITIIIGLLTGGGMSFSSGNFDDIFDKFDDKSYSQKSDDGSEFGGFGDFTDPFEGFDGTGMATVNKLAMGAAGLGAIAAFGALLSGALSLVLGPLRIMLAGLYWQFIRGNNMDFGNGLGYIFKNTFDKNYLNKFLLNLLQGILLALLYCLFIIPGVIFTYKWYFTSYIMAENPELSFDEAMNLSKKMTNNHKGELFVMDLSFIPWYLLMLPTLGIVGIYVAPYVQTTRALYYENFKIRAFQENAITQYDFIPNKQKLASGMQTPNPQAPQMNSFAPQQNTYYAPAQPQQNTYAAPVQPQQQTYVAPEPQQNNVYEAETPSQEYYTPTPPTDDNF